MQVVVGNLVEFGDAARDGVERGDEMFGAVFVGELRMCDVVYGVFVSQSGADDDGDDAGGDESVDGG